MTVMRELLNAGKNAKARGLDPDQARDEVLPHLKEVMLTMTNDDPKLNDQFRIYLVDWYMHRAYDELKRPVDRRDRRHPAEIGTSRRNTPDCSSAEAPLRRR
jgi:hypothetical protein